ncbi:MAG TPA: sugar phosphate isomerase/epimerase family protein [bacterium]|nr:sugar phosphate isomerase/epimerase family protein [bacterium]HPP29670.1 sugar phosphate isomerase/epimerase family protein [bacterium]
MKITWKWAACGYNLLGYQSTEEIIELCKYAGIPAIEMNSGFTNGRANKELEEMGKQYKDAGIELYSFHLPFSQEDDISSFYETKRREIVNRLIRVMEQASLIGCKIVILHPSTVPFCIEVEGLDRYVSQMGKSIETLIPAAERLNLTIALENMLPSIDGERFGSSPEHFIIFAEKFAHPHFGFCLDTGHANVSCESDGPSIFFEVMRKHLVAFHIQDNPGDRDLHLAPGYGLINWNVLFRKMAEIKFSHPACIETPPFGPANHYKYDADIWKKMFEEMDVLVTNL